jgi:hypothetical protein
MRGHGKLAARRGSVGVDAAPTVVQELTGPSIGSSGEEAIPTVTDESYLGSDSKERGALVFFDARFRETAEATLR